jgi:hypothetical protein
MHTRQSSTKLSACSSSQTPRKPRADRNHRVCAFPPHCPAEAVRLPHGRSPTCFSRKPRALITGLAFAGAAGKTLQEFRVMRQIWVEDRAAARSWRSDENRRKAAPVVVAPTHQRSLAVPATPRSHVALAKKEPEDGRVTARYAGEAQTAILGQVQQAARDLVAQPERAVDSSVFPKAFRTKALDPLGVNHVGDLAFCWQAAFGCGPRRCWNWGRLIKRRRHR